MIGEARRPLIYAGGGVVAGEAANVLREFSEAFGIPVVTTLMGIGAVDTTNPLCMRMLGMHGTAFANYTVDDCDFLFALGARFDDRVAGVPAKFARNARRIAHIDIDRAEVNKVKRAQWAHIGPMAEALRALTAYGKRQKFARDYTAWHAHLAELKSKFAMNYDRNSTLIQPYYVIEEINKHAKGQAIISTGVGQHHVGRAVLRLPRAPAVAHLGQHGNHGLRPARRHRRADRPPEPPRHRYRRRLEHPHERGRARDRDHV
jgi:acetolactate synthase-1/2/3 large subunit